MLKTYVHELNTKVQSVGGGYEIKEEKRIRHRGKEFLCLLAQAVVDSSCCGSWGCYYAVIPGMVLEWKGALDEESRALSRLETIEDPDLKEELRGMILKNESVEQVLFW